MRKLDTLAAGFPDIYKLMEQGEISKAYSFPKTYVSCRKLRDTGKAMSHHFRR